MTSPSEPEGVLRTEDDRWAQYRRACEEVERAAAEAIFMAMDAGVAHLETAMYDLQQVVEHQAADG